MLEREKRFFPSANNRHKNVLGLSTFVVAYVLTSSLLCRFLLKFLVQDLVNLYSFSTRLQIYC